MNQPIISVILPVYNAESFLDETIQSILNQSYRDFEFIIINDGSIDSSIDIINKYRKEDSRIVLINRENKGFVYSLNEAISLAKGKYIARMDADDISFPNRFQEQIKILEEMDNIDIVGCHYQLINNNSEVTGEVKVPLTSNDILMSLCYSVPFAHPSVMIRKEVFEYFKYEDSPTEDYLLWSKIYKNNNFYNINKFLLQYRYQYGNSFSDTKRLKMIKSEGIIVDSFFQENENEIMYILNNEFQSNIYFIRALVSIFIFSKKDKRKIIVFIKNRFFLFIQYYLRHYIRLFYWKLK